MRDCVAGHPGAVPGKEIHPVSCAGGGASLYSAPQTLPVKKTTKTSITSGLRLAKLCRTIAEDKKAENVLLLDMRKVSTLTDYMLICSGNSEPHLKAIADEIGRQLRDLGCRPKGRDGAPPSRWVVLDYNDVLIHIFHPEVREHYALEHLWGDAKRVK